MTNLFRKLKNKSVMLKMLITGWVILIGLGLTAFSQNNEIFPIPETYQIEGIPAIKNSEVENLFYDSSAIKSNLIWDADRKNRKILVTDQTNNIWLLDTPLSQPVKLIEKVIPNLVKVNPNGETFAYTSDHEQEDSYQLYLYYFKEKTSKRITNLASKEQSIESFIWSPKGDRLVYTIVDYVSKTSKICQNNLVSESCFPADLKGIWNVLDSKEDKILLKYWKASSSQFIYIYDIQNKKLMPIDEKGNCRKGFFAGETVIWTTEDNNICKRNPCLLSLDLKNNKTTQLTLPPNFSNLNDAKISPEGDKLLLQDSKDGIDNLRVFQLKKNKIVKEFPNFISGSNVIWNIRWLTNNEIVYTLEDISKPASIHSFNLESKQVMDWTKERLPIQLEDKIKSPEFIRWKSFDQKEISGYVVRPKTAPQKSPVLIFVHGGPQILDTPTFNSQDIRLAANLGMTIIHTNIRGSSDFGNEFMNADNKEKRGDAVKDIQALLDWIEKQPDLDSKQIYIRGQSYGGFIVLSTALQEPLRIKGVIAEYPLVSIRGYLSQSWIDEFAKTEYGDPADENLMVNLDKLSPLNNTDRWNQIPLFITRGKLDTRSPEKNVTDLKTQLQNKGSEVWFIYSTNSGHGFGGKYVFAAMYQFLKKQINMENKK